MKIENLYDEHGDPAPGSDWVFEGEGSVEPLVANATQVLNTGDRWMMRVDIGPGETPPEGFEPGQETEEGGLAGWVPDSSTDRPDPAEAAPGVYLEVPGKPLTHLPDLKPIDEIQGSPRNLPALLRKAARRGDAGLVFRHAGMAFKTSVN